MLPPWGIQAVPLRPAMVSFCVEPWKVLVQRSLTEVKLQKIRAHFFSPEISGFPSHVSNQLAQQVLPYLALNASSSHPPPPTPPFSSMYVLLIVNPREINDPMEKWRFHLLWLKRRKRKSETDIL